MKIVHWDEAFHPLFGYQINLLAKYQAMQGHDVTIVSSKNINSFPVFNQFDNSNLSDAEMDEEFSKKYKVKIIRWPWRKSFLAKNRIVHKKGFIELLSNIEADIIFVHTNDTLSSIKIAKKHKKIKTPLIFDNHMLDMASKNPLRKLFRLYFKLRITPLIKKNKWIVIRTQDDPYIIKHFGVPKSQAPYLSFGTDLSIFHTDESQKKEFMKKNNLYTDTLTFIYTGKLTEDKGGLLLANAFLKSFDGKRVNLIVVGNSFGEYGQCVEQLLKNSENKVLRFPTQNYASLPMFYQSADISIFPKQCSLSFFDAQACGLPVIAENNNINIERLSHKNGSVFLSGDVEDFRKIIKKYIFMDIKDLENERINSTNYIKKYFDFSKIAEEYSKIIEAEWKRQKENL
ncbi:MAG: glycosyltransferase family 4 protein [Bacilli bacterium]|nr:glycosyltransferase family 4 protein [Bacilli bacterium]